MDARAADIINRAINQQQMAQYQEQVATWENRQQGIGDVLGGLGTYFATGAASPGGASGSGASIMDT